MTVALVFDPAIAGYRFSEDHPLRPERFTLSVSLMRAWGLLADTNVEGLAPGGVERAQVWAPSPATDDDLRLVHSPQLIAAVKAASSNPSRAEAAFGIGPGDTPAFAGMHEATALAVGGTLLALGAVLDGSALRTFNPAGGLHHAMRDRASGFCVYNDCAVAIARATRDHPGLRVAYVDIDAHHGDGVEAAFWERADVLTASIHESGRFLFPGTGATRDVGEGAGKGFSVNAPLLPGAGPGDFLDAFESAVAPAVRRFAPDVVVAQLGGDSYRGDPLTHLDNTVAGHHELVVRIVALADEVCGGRIAATGGGGYESFSAVPRMWACAMAELMGAEIPAELPAEWLAESNAAAGWEHAPATMTFQEPVDEVRP